MKISLNWLKELVNVPWEIDELSEKLMLLGFPVAGVEQTGVQATNIVVAKILAVEKHPNADRLSVTKIFDGKGERTVVCGATNIAAGQIVPLALPGAKFKDGFEISISKIRGVESHGMLCSERELGISEEHAGILQLPATSKIGADIRTVVGKGDVVLDIEISPNRPDLLSHVGVAREIAALTGQKLKLPASPWKAGKGEKCQIKIEDPVLCERYLGKIFTSVKVGPAPEWMAARLKACGIRSINNIVDITNYVLLEWGHPLHAFDLDKLKGHQLVVRKARQGEKLAALDEKTYALGITDLVIADASEPVAIAGIMGGQASGVSDQTQSILLESAVFSPGGVRLTSKRLGLKSESSIRFEKGTDAETAVAASVRAASLILELSGAKAEGAADSYPKKRKSIFVDLDLKSYKKLIGQDEKPTRIQEFLERLGFGVTKKGTVLKTQVPAWRKDVLLDVDLIEEVVRMSGYDQIPATLPKPGFHPIPDSMQIKNTDALTYALRGLGFNEVITSSFCNEGEALRFGVPADDIVALRNPLSQEETVMRPLGSPTLLNALQLNVNHQRESVFLYEIGKRFRRVGKNETHEDRILTIGAYGLISTKQWQTPEKEVDVYFVKAVIEALAKSLGRELKFDYRQPGEFLHPHQSFHVKTISGEPCGWGGLLHPQLAAQRDLKRPAALIELNLNRLLANLPNQKKIAPIPKYPAVERDLAIVVDSKLGWGEIESLVKSAGGEILRSVQPFDIFSGGSLPADKKSVAFRMNLRNDEHTLSDAEITGVIEKVKSQLSGRLGAQLRQ